MLRLSLAGENLNIECCDCGEDALREVSKAPTNVLLVNVYLPDMDGFELCRRLQAANLRTRVVMLVGAFQSFDEEKARAVGCSHSLSKPFDTYSLVNMVKHLIAAGQEPEVEESGLVFEPVLGSVGRDLVFDLSVDQCHCHPKPMARELAVDNFPRVEEFDQGVPVTTKPQPGLLDPERLLAKLAERVPEAIKKVLPEIVREMDESR